MNYYEILGIKKTATKSEIKDAYKSLVKKYHPDIYVGDKHFAERKIKEINNAYDTLSDEKLKKEYDESINPIPSYTYNTDFNKSTYSNDYTTQKYSSNYSQTDFYKKYTQTTNPFYNASYSGTRNKYENTVYNKVDALAFKSKLTLFFIAIFLLLLFFLNSTIQYYNLINKKDNEINNYQGLNIIDFQMRPNIENITTNENNFEIQNKYDENAKVYDYFSESDIINMYNNYFIHYYDSYNEFKKELFEYMENSY